MSLENWKSIADWATMVLIALTVFSGSAALILGDRINEKQAEQQRKFEQNVAPRQLAMVLSGGKWNFDGLKPFAGVQVIIEVLPDAEAYRAAGYITPIIKEAGWVTVGEISNPKLMDAFFDGVIVESYLANTPPGTEATPEQKRDENNTLLAARALVDFLKSNNWEARHMWPPKSRRNIPPNAIRISVGFKPNPYFLQKEIDTSAK